MNQLPFISVIIPTYNRGNYLPLTIDSFINQNYPKERFEIIISNNNSTDNTAEIIADYCSKHDNIKSILETRQGAHYARNSAAKVSKGDILYYTDDDMVADSDLLINLVGIFIDNPEVGCATGKVLPKWESEPPEWILKLCNNGMLSLNDLGDNTIISAHDIGIFSCHQAIRREVFFKSEGFNPDYVVGELLGDGETGLNIKIKKLGYKFAYTGNSIIYHMIPPSRMTQNYLNKRFANQGNCDSYTDYRKHRYNEKDLYKKIINHIIKLIRRFMRFIVKKTFSKDIWRLELAYIYYYINRIKYDYRLIKEESWRELVLKYNWLSE